MSKTKDKELEFEEAQARLEAIVEAMEAGDIPLSELVAKYEEGSKLLSICQHKLKDAELRISKIREDQQKLIEEPFEPGEQE